MKEWLKNGLIGYGAFISIQTFSAYFILPPFKPMWVDLIIGALGGIIVGRNQKNWKWPVLGGLFAFIIAAAGFVLYFLLLSL